MFSSDLKEEEEGDIEKWDDDFVFSDETVVKKVNDSKVAVSLGVMGKEDNWDEDFDFNPIEDLSLSPAAKHRRESSNGSVLSGSSKRDSLSHRRKQSSSFHSPDLQLIVDDEELNLTLDDEYGVRMEVVDDDEDDFYDDVIPNVGFDGLDDEQLLDSSATVPPVPSSSSQWAASSRLLPSRPSVTLYNGRGSMSSSLIRMHRSSSGVGVRRREDNEVEVEDGQEEEEELEADWDLEMVDSYPMGGGEGTNRGMGMMQRQQESSSSPIAISISFPEAMGGGGGGRGKPADKEKEVSPPPDESLLEFLEASVQSAMLTSTSTSRSLPPPPPPRPCRCGRCWSSRSTTSGCWSPPTNT